MKLLHFADAHIDMANYGRHDPESGLPVRVLDFLKSLDTIVETAIREGVDLVIFAGDAYKDRTPAPTFQREWGRRIMRLSQAGIPTLLLVGNHDISPSIGRAHTLQEFNTFAVPHVQVIDRPVLLDSQSLGLPAQVIGLPWAPRSGLMAALAEQPEAGPPQEIFQTLEEILSRQLLSFIEQADPSLPLLLTAHASVQGAQFGGERLVMLGNDLVLSPALLKDPRLDYVALGHIHKPQDLNQGQHPPVIYPGSIEKVDFGEAADDKFFIVAEVQRGHTTVEWRKLDTRPFLDCFLRLEDASNVTAQALQALPDPQTAQGAIVRLTLEYPREMETLIDENALREAMRSTLEFDLLKRPLLNSRTRLGVETTLAALLPQEALNLYWQSLHTDPDEIETLNCLASSLFFETESD